MAQAQEMARLVAVAEELLARIRADEHRRRDERLIERFGAAQRTVPKLGTAMLLKAIPGLAARFDRTVPDEFVAQTAERELTVACPCGESPVVTSEQLAGCECGRWFLHDGARVHVAHSPKPATTDAE